MTKAEIRSLIVNLLPKYEETERWHPRVIDAAIEKALAEFYNLVFLRNPIELERYTKQFGYTTAIPLLYEATTGLYYSNYPTGISIIPMPDKASGVRRISTMIQGQVTFYPMDARELDLILNECYVNIITDKIGYIPRRTRIEYYNPSASVITSGVRMDLLIPFSQYEDTDIVMVPELTGSEGGGLVERILQILERVKPQELYENKQFESKE